ncbi:TIGR04149 family rSAM-modified RiPP [Aggregatimonas sangjinii]|nr:TIGR04149 family rSAM-modified RiPP [Aggregatimonas sangjinii]
MKSLSSLNFEANEVLQRSQMKTVFGGAVCSSGSSEVGFACADGTSGGSYTICNEHYDAFVEMAEDFCG